MIAKANPKCRRCSECEGREHHWLCELDCEQDPPRWDFVCKHCDAVGLECEGCEGEGCDHDGEVTDGCYPPCSECNGEGVIYTGEIPEGYEG